MSEIRFVAKGHAAASLGTAAHAALRFGLPQVFVHEATSTSTALHNMTVGFIHRAVSASTGFYGYSATILDAIAPPEEAMVVGGYGTIVRAYSSPRASVGTEGDYGGRVIPYNGGGARVLAPAEKATRAR